MDAGRRTVGARTDARDARGDRARGGARSRSPTTRSRGSEPRSRRCSGRWPSDRPVYGLTTGLGARRRRSAAARARPTSSRPGSSAAGRPRSASRCRREAVRAAMVVRLNGLCAGGCGRAAGGRRHARRDAERRRPPDRPAHRLDRRRRPVPAGPRRAGAAGEGEAELDGERLRRAEALRRAGIAARATRPGDGLALCNASAVAAGRRRPRARVGRAPAGRGRDRRRALDGGLPRVGLRRSTRRRRRPPGARPGVGGGRPARAAAGGSLPSPGAARRLQDPLSFRCAQPRARRAALGPRPARGRASSPS